MNLRDPGAARANRYDPDRTRSTSSSRSRGCGSRSPRRRRCRPPGVRSGRRGSHVLPDGGSRIAAERRTGAGGILLQSGPENLGGQNPERIQIQLDTALVTGARPAVAVGDRLDDVTGVVRYDFGNYEVAATEPLRVRRRRPARRPTRLGAGRGPADRGQLQRAQSERATRGLDPARPARAADRAGPGRSRRSWRSRRSRTTAGSATTGPRARPAPSRSSPRPSRPAGGPATRGSSRARDGRQGGAPGGNIRNAFLYDPAQVRLLRFASLTPALPDAAGGRDTDLSGLPRPPHGGVRGARTPDDLHQQSPHLPLRLDAGLWRGPAVRAGRRGRAGRASGGPRLRRTCSLDDRRADARSWCSAT